MLVNRRPLLDQRIDIGHCHEDPHSAACENLAGRQLIEIERVVVVDRTPRQLRKIPNSRVVFPAGAADRCQLLLNTGWKLRLQSALGHRFGGNADKIVPRSMTCRIHRPLDDQASYLNERDTLAR